MLARKTKETIAIFVILSAALLVDLGLGSPQINMDVDIPEKYKNVEAGEEVLLQVSIYEFRTNEPDVGVTYYITDLSGNIVTTESETKAIETQAVFSKSLHVPHYLRAGNYFAKVEISYDGRTYTATKIFHVYEGETPPNFFEELYGMPAWFICIFIGILGLVAGALVVPVFALSKLYLKKLKKGHQ